MKKPPPNPDPQHPVRPRWKPSPAFLALVASLILFSALVENLLARGWWFYLDSRMLQLTEGATPPFWTWLMDTMTFLGGRRVMVAIVVLLAGFLLLRKQWRHLVLVGVTLGSGQMVSSILKAIYHRARPPAPLIEVQGSSFPSGNAFLALLVYGLVVYLIWNLVADQRGRLAGIGVSGLLALAVGCNRLQLRAHWLSDVLAAYLVGFAWLIICILLVNYFWPAPGAIKASTGSPPES